MSYYSIFSALSEYRELIIDGSHIAPATCVAKSDKIIVQQKVPDNS